MKILVSVTLCVRATGPDWKGRPGSSSCDGRWMLGWGGFYTEDGLYLRVKPWKVMLGLECCISECLD